MDKRIIISWFLVILWMLVIFSFSHMNGDNSNSKSKGTINKILETTNKVGITNIDITEGKEAEAVDKLNGPLRKLMHMGVYFILALLVINALRVSNVKFNLTYLLTFIICFIYACTDEYHQTLIADRSGEFRDVLIDSFGSIIGILFNYLLLRIRKVIKKKS